MADQFATVWTEVEHRALVMRAYAVYDWAGYHYTESHARTRLFLIAGRMLTLLSLLRPDPPD